MNKQEFIDRLRASLNGKISAAEVEDTVQYYKDYIDSEIRKGKRESEVLDMLGDPRLIARTIVETSQPIEDTGDVHGSRGSYYDNQSYQNGNTYHSNSQQEETFKKPKIFRMPGWLLIILAVLILYLILSVVFSVLAFLAPVIIVAAVVIFLVKLFRDWLN